MAGRGRLIAGTVVRNPDNQAVVRLRAGDKVPDWAEDQVGDHLFKAKDAPAEGEQPPRAGRGSGLEAWTAYAEGLDIEVPEGATRDEVIDLVEAQQA